MSRPFKGAKTTTKSLRFYDYFLLPALAKYNRKKGQKSFNQMMNDFADSLTSIKEKQDYFNNQKP